MTTATHEGALRLYRQRTHEICQAVQHFVNEHEAWTEAKRTREFLDDRYWAAFEHSLALLSSGSIPESCRALVEAFQRVEEEKVFFEETARRTPADRFWFAVDMLKKSLEATKNQNRERRGMVETPSQLADQGVAHEQIASEFGITLDELRRELAEPGSIVDPATWVHPFDRKAAEDNAAIADEFAKLDAEERRQREEFEAFAEKAAEESTWELWINEVEVTQAAAMKRMPESEMQAIYDGYANEWELLERGVPKRRAKPLVDPATMAVNADKPKEDKEPRPTFGGPEAPLSDPQPAVDMDSFLDSLSPEKRAALRERLVDAVWNGNSPLRGSQPPAAAEQPSEPEPQTDLDADESAAAYPDDIDEGPAELDMPETLVELKDLCEKMGVEVLVPIPEDYAELKAAAKEFSIETRGNPRADRLGAKLTYAVLAGRVRAKWEAMNQQ